MKKHLRTFVSILFFAITVLFFGGFCFTIPSAHAAIQYVSGTTTSSRTWTSDITYVVSSSLTIASGTTLTVNSGTVVKFVQNGTLTVNGNGVLNVLGDPANLVYFTASKDSTVG